MKYTEVSNVSELIRCLIKYRAYEIPTYQTPKNLLLHICKWGHVMYPIDRRGMRIMEPISLITSLVTRHPSRGQRRTKLSKDVGEGEVLE
jgi:hypothetical protein